LLLATDAITELFRRVEANVIEEGMAAEVFDWGYRIENNTGILPIRGALAQRPDLIHMYLGGSSVDMLAQHFQELMADNSVGRIVLDIDSPGGYVSPIAEFASQIFAARDKKEIIAVVNSSAFSAAYWIASAAKEIVMNDATAAAGSVGVYIAHVDISKREEKWGYKTTEITAGKYKAVGSPYKPLSDEGRATYQERANYFYEMFVNAVAEYRNLDLTALETWADGKIFIGQQAIDVGLADRIGSFTSVIGANLMTEPQIAATPPVQAPNITEAYLAANHPQLLAGIKTASYEDGLKAGIEQGEKKERARVLAIEALEKSPVYEGFSDVFAKAKAEGLTKSQTNELLVSAQMERGIKQHDIRQDATQAGQYSGGAKTGDELDEPETQAMLKNAVDAVFQKKGGRR